jgi:diguanylate cyclase (GGDEF)-like protein
MTVRRSLFLALVTALVPLLALGFAAYLITRDAVDAGARLRADVSARLTTEVVEQRIEVATSELGGVAEWPDLVLPSLGVARGGGDDQREAAGTALEAASSWWSGFDSLTVHSRTGPVVTTRRESAVAVDQALLAASLAGETVVGGWSAERGTFQVGRPLVGAEGDAAIVAEVPIGYLEAALAAAEVDGAVRVVTAEGAVILGDPDRLSGGASSSRQVAGSSWQLEAVTTSSGNSTGDVLVATVLAMVALLCVVAVTVSLLGGSLVSRLRRLAATAEAIGEGRLDQRTGLGGNDEIAQAALSFDRMADSLVTDISHRRQMETLLVQQALHDPLTGLANRAKLIDRLGEALVRSSRSGLSVGLLFCDLDGFKRVNDELGHSAGDDLLMLVADRFRSSVRPSDTVARFGGDEFVVLCADLRDPGDALAVADRLRAAFESPFLLGGTEVSTSTSIGIAVGTGGTVAPDDLLRRADQAMYQAKGSGKARHVLYEVSADAEELTRAERAQEVRRALDRSELILHYQPIVELATDRTAGYEAYVRWQHPSRGEVRPQELIDVATSAGLAGDVDLWVLGTALDELRGSGDDSLWTAVNLTPGSLATPDFAAAVSSVLQERGTTPDSVVLEVSEASLSGEPGRVLATLDELHELGVRLAIDDFGTGHSSLDRLRRCPVDSIKIHQTLVHGLVADDDDRSAVQAIVSMAAALDLSVVAEGVETDEQLEVLRDLGCEYVQGYLLASPAPAAELAGSGAREPEAPSGAGPGGAEGSR